jgi:hypothetical protein
MATNGFTPGSWRMLLTAGKAKLPPNGHNSVDFALVYSRVNDATNWPNALLGKMKSDITKVKNWYAGNSFPSCLQINVGIKEPDRSGSQIHSIRIYPNPATHDITFSGLDETGSNRFEIYDLSGRILLSGKAQNEQSVDVKSLPAGLFLVRIYNERASTVIKMLKE